MRIIVKIKLNGEAGKNTAGIGAKVYIKTAHNNQMQEQYTSRGFQSSVDPIMHIGLGDDSIIQSIKIKWVGGKESLLENIKADTLLVINQNTASVPHQTKTNVNAQPIFEDVTQSSGINYQHQQSSFVDFKISPLLPYQLSKVGPCISKADVNGDGLEDFFIGGSADHESIFYVSCKLKTENLLQQLFNHGTIIKNQPTRMLFFLMQMEMVIWIYIS